MINIFEIADGGPLEIAVKYIASGFGWRLALTMNWIYASSFLLGHKTEVMVVEIAFVTPV